MNTIKTNHFSNTEPSERQRGTSVFALLSRWFRLEHGISSKFIAKVLFISFLGLLYIANTHNCEKIIRRMAKIKSEIEDLRTDYITMKAEYMKASKQSEVAKKMAQLGLKELSKPPFKIIVE